MRVRYNDELIMRKDLIEINHSEIKGRKKDFGKVMGVFLRIIGPLAEAI
jgi:hypothetical protein